MTCWATLLSLASAPAGGQGLVVEELRVDGKRVERTTVVVMRPAPDQAAQLTLVAKARFEPGFEIEVPARTVIVIRSEKDNLIELVGGTRFRVEATSERGEWYSLLAGSIAVRVRNALDFFNVEFDPFVARVRGTDFTLEVGADRNAAATVREGTVSILREVPTQLGDRAQPVPMLETERVAATAGDGARRFDLSRDQPLRRYNAPEEALNTYKSELERAESAGDPDAAYAALNNMGLTEIALGRPEDARADFERLLTLASTRGDVPWRARALNNLAGAQMRGQQWAAARTTLEAALAVNRSMAPAASARRMAQNEGNLGIVLRHLGEREGARAASDRSLALYRTLPGDQSAGIARNLENLGHLDPASAIDLHKQALDLRAKLYGDQPNAETASSHGNLGSALCLAGRPDEGLAELDVALKMRLALRTPTADPDLAAAYEALADCWARAASTGRPYAGDKAVEYVRRAKEERARGQPRSDR
ncbi:MAG TPA: tetratricopeptide repeat protein [Burkholderiales bacterium]|nr:tetratricopeptide repeat protein [Burkholderiales bacterium]